MRDQNSFIFIIRSNILKLNFQLWNDYFYSLAFFPPDLTSLLKTQPVPQSVACGENCIERMSSSSDDFTANFAANSTTVVVVFAFVGALMLLLAIASVLYKVKKRQERGEMDREGGIEPERINGCKYPASKTVKIQVFVDH